MKVSNSQARQHLNRNISFFCHTFFQVQIKQEPKPAVPVNPLPSTGPNIQISQVHSGAPAVAASTVKVKTEREEDR